MFSLIITIISIALVAALAVATIYYGGSAFTQGSAKANAATLISQAQQITGAEVLYANDHSGAFDATLSDLMPTYLQSIPSVPTTVAGTYGVDTNNVFTASVVEQSVCAAIDATVGITTIPSTAPTDAQYYCESGTGTPATYTFTYNGG